MKDRYSYYSHEESEEHKGASSLYFILFSSLLFGVLIMSKYLHEAPLINKYLSEAALILIVGLICGFLTETILELDSSNEDDDESDIAFQRLISFSPNIFFMALLPPILFNSGYQLRRELFLRHIYPIVIFAVFGTVVSTITCALILWGLQNLGCFSVFDPTLLELFAFGSLIAATDTVSVIAVLQAKRVDPHLFYVVFGESALNDAVALVLFNSFADLLRANKAYSYESFMAFFPEFFIDAVGSPVLGMLFGFFAALLFKKVDMRKKKYRMLELSLFLMLMYVPFIISESFHLSGIVTIFFAGLSVRRYVSPNVSRVTEKAGATIFQLVAFLAETCIFLELGLSIFGFKGKFQWDFIMYSLGAALIARGAAIYPLAFVHNYAIAKEIEKYEAELARTRSQMQMTNPNLQHTNSMEEPIRSPMVINPTLDEPTTFGQAGYIPPASIPQPLPTPQHLQPSTLGSHPTISSLDDFGLNPNSPNYVPGDQTFAAPQVNSNVPPPSPQDVSTPSIQNKSIQQIQPAIVQTQLAPLPPTMHEHQIHIPLEAQQNLQSLRNRQTGTSFDTEDSRHSGTTVTTNVSRKRRERRGRWSSNVKKERISLNMMHILWFAGLRGVVAYACVREFPDLHGNKDEFTAAVMFIVLFTIVIMGGLTESMLGWLNIETGVDLEEYMDIFRQEQDLTGAFHDLGMYFCSCYVRFVLQN